MSRWFAFACLSLALAVSGNVVCAEDVEEALQVVDLPELLTPSATASSRRVTNVSYSDYLSGSPTVRIAAPVAEAAKPAVMLTPCLWPLSGFATTFGLSEDQESPCQSAPAPSPFQQGLFNEPERLVLPDRELKLAMNDGPEQPSPVVKEIVTLMEAMGPSPLEGTLFEQDSETAPSASTHERRLSFLADLEAEQLLIADDARVYHDYDEVPAKKITTVADWMDQKRPQNATEPQLVIDPPKPSSLFRTPQTYFNAEASDVAGHDAAQAILKAREQLLHAASQLEQAYKYEEADKVLAAAEELLKSARSLTAPKTGGSARRTISFEVPINRSSSNGSGGQLIADFTDGPTGF